MTQSNENSHCFPSTENRFRLYYAWLPITAVPAVIPVISNTPKNEGCTVISESFSYPSRARIYFSPDGKFPESLRFLIPEIREIFLALFRGISGKNY